MAQIFVIDDDPFIGMIAQTLLATSGHTVVTASTGAEALGWCDDAVPDLVLLDIRLPDICGLQILSQLRARPGWTYAQILMLSASHDMQHVLEAKQRGAAGFVSKAMRADALAELVSDILSDIGPNRFEVIDSYPGIGPGFMH